MLRIGASQLNAFEQASRRRFEDEMVAHSKDFSPRLCEVLGDEQLRIALRSAMQRAQGYGFTWRGPVRLYIELMFLYGSGLDTDPQYPSLGELLREPGDQMERAQRLHEAALYYLDKVCGPDNANVRRALASLRAFAERPIAFPKGFGRSMLDHMVGIFPQKAAYVGEGGLRALIEEGVNQARRHRFTTERQAALLVTLMFAFGHSCTRDALYPWIERTLMDDRISEPRIRAERLERKSVTWLEHVLARKPPEDGRER